MKNQKLNLLDVIKAQAQKLNLWNSDIGDRLSIDSISSKRMEIYSALRSKYIVRAKNKCRHYDRMPVHLIPNCASYQGENNPLSWLHGIFKMVSRSRKQGGKMIGWASTNKNGFIKYRMNAMGWARDKGHYRDYWRQFENLMKNPVFKVCALNFVVKNWHLDVSGPRLQKILIGVDELVKNRSIKIDYKRVYIPKPNGKLRPLGVPEISWRIYLHMWNVGLVWFRLKDDENQHAYLPKRGVYTCWRDVWPKLELPNIYEFDLKNFFPSVKLDYLKDRMLNTGIPENISELLTLQNQSIVKLTDEDEVEEPHRKVIYNCDGSVNPNLEADLKKEIESKPESVTKLYERGYTEYVERGVPQGAPTSCGLATYNLHELFNRSKDLTMYSDDGLDFPKTPEQPNLTIEEAGVYQEFTKSGWVKKEGSFLKSLKFLGLEFIPADIPPLDGTAPKSYPRLRGATRNGSEYEFTERLQFLCYVSKYLTEKDNHLIVSNWVKEKKTIGECLTELYTSFTLQNPMDKLGYLFNSPTGPTVLSCIYNNTDQLQEPTDNRLLYKRNSWVNGRYAHYIYVMLQLSLMFPETKNYARLIIDSHLRPVDTEKEDTDNIDSIKKSESLRELKEFISSEARSSLGGLALSSWFRFHPSVEEELKRDIEQVTAEGQIENFKRYRRLWKSILKLLKLDLYNASSFACHDLLASIESGNNFKNWSRKKDTNYVRFVKLQKLVNTDKEQLKKEFEKKKADLKKRLLRRGRMELRNTYK